jgi:GTP-binding protein EngB required for normal cell division
VSAEQLAAQSRALAEAIAVGGRQLDPRGVDLAENLVEKVRERTSLAAGLTVVALAGATGSGKSSLFNALVGRPVAAIGARRPTTSTPSAAVWGAEPAAALLDWLSVRTRHIVPSEGTTDPVAGVVGSLDGLVLLDLPDFDSRVDSHRVEAERILELVDVFVWVTDPQKYADALLHDDHLRALAGHDAVTLVVLNQSDRLTSPEAVTACREDLQRLLAQDGITDAKVSVTSARTGNGIPELRQRLANAVSGATAARFRLSADIVSVAGSLRSGVADSEATVDASPSGSLVAALSRAAGVPVVLQAVEHDYRRETHQRGGWLLTRWVSSLRADPLARLRLSKTIVPMADVGADDVRAVLGRSSIPAPSPSARAAVALATRQLADSAGQGLPVRWADAVADAAAPTGAKLADALDQAVVHTPLRARSPIWWTVMGALQWVFGIMALDGVAWLAVLGVVGWLRLPDLPTPTLGNVSWPFILFAGGLLLGVLSAGLATGLGRVGARRRVRLIGRRVGESITGVAREHIVDPVAAVLARHRRTREQLDLARRG